jgi:hypothetical protein
MEENLEQEVEQATITKKPFFKTPMGIITTTLFIVVVIGAVAFFSQQKGDGVVSDQALGIAPISDEQKEEIIQKNIDTLPITEEQKQAILEKNKQ